MTRNTTLRQALPVLCVIAALLLGGCESEDGWPDDHVLNSDLIGTWKSSGGEGAEAWFDEYTITQTSITHTTDYPAFTNAEIRYVYNFNEHKSAGGIIIERDDGKFSVVWFKDLHKQEKVLLGDPFDGQHTYGASNYIADVAVDTLDAARKRFTPASAASWGGGSRQTGSPQLWVAP